MGNTECFSNSTSELGNVKVVMQPIRSDIDVSWVVSYLGNWFVCIVRDFLREQAA